MRKCIFVTFTPEQYILFYSVCSALTLYDFKNIEGWSSLLSGAVQSLPVCLLCDWPTAVAKLVFLFWGKLKVECDLFELPPAACDSAVLFLLNRIFFF